KYPGYSFGREDLSFSPLYESFAGEQTMEDGRAYLDLALPEFDDPGRPLNATFVVRVSEGSGRPVERRISRDLAPSAPMIGVKPLFDGVVGEGAAAEFQVIGVGTDLAPEPMSVKWTLTRIETDYQWYQSYGSWSWEPVTLRKLVDEGQA